MPENVLEKIIQKKSEKIINLKKNVSLDSLNEMINKNKSFINFKEKIENNIKENKFSIIAEIKKASATPRPQFAKSSEMGCLSVGRTSHSALRPDGSFAQSVIMLSLRTSL